jgi:hypothetical protein
MGSVQRVETHRLKQTLSPGSAEDLCLKLHHFALWGTPFFGMKIVPGGVTLFTCEKLRWFSARAMRPREST